MPRKRLLWQLFPTYLLLVICVLLAVTWYDMHSLRNFYVRHIADDLRVQARLVERQMTDALAAGKLREIDAACKSLGRRSQTRFTVILPNGVVAGDSQESPALMDNHAGREEVHEAFAGTMGQATRYSHTLRQPMMYLAVPLQAKGRCIGVLRTSLPVLSIGRILHRVDVQLVLAGLIIAVLAALISLLVSRRISRPLEELRMGALRFAQGDLQKKLPVPASDEIGGLAQAMNEMAGQLDERIRVILQHRNEQDTILSSMSEGVLAVDMDERLISINQAAESMLQLPPGQSIGRSIQEVVRNADLQQFIGRALSDMQPVEEDIVLRDGEARHLQASGTMLSNAQGKAIGAVVVLNDITRIHRLETVRRDFVANVSHELRTPITSIKGFVEVLVDGGLDERGDAEHFLQVIAKQVDRLDAIITDLLMLSTMESGDSRSAIGLEMASVDDVVQVAMQVCAIKAQEKRITLRWIPGPQRWQARMNPPLLEQAVVNLIDNAVKYSQPDNAVEITTQQRIDSVVISVMDHGCGISREHLPRLFERFYRVDKARSRKLGGTGLGLAIVKHIAQAHNGLVTVVSTPGKGSVFSIHLPVADYSGEDVIMCQTTSRE